MGLIISTRITIEDADAARFGAPDDPHPMDATEAILRVTLSGPFRRRTDVAVTLAQLRAGVSFIFAALSSEIVGLRPHVEAVIADATPPQWAPLAFRTMLMHQEVPDTEVGSLMLRVHSRASQTRRPGES